MQADQQQILEHLSTGNHCAQKSSPVRLGDPPLIQDAKFELVSNDQSHRIEKSKQK